MKIGFLFPGQGSQSVGMGKDLYEKYEEVRNIYNKAEEITRIDIKEISFEGPEELLNKTKYTQIAILVNSLSILEILKKHNITADMQAGLSLGEYTALINSGAISFKEGVNLVKKRGEYMQNLLPKGDWQMAAIMGLTNEQVEEVCKKVKKRFCCSCKLQLCRSSSNFRRRKSNISSRDNCKRNGCKKSKSFKNCRTISYNKAKRKFRCIKKRIRKSYNT